MAVHDPCLSYRRRAGARDHGGPRVKAPWDDDRTVSYYVLTGSHNITVDALRNNDELLLRLGRNQTAHDEFVQHFASAWNPGGNDFLCLGSSTRLASNTNCDTHG